MSKYTREEVNELVRLYKKQDSAGLHKLGIHGKEQLLEVLIEAWELPYEENLQTAAAIRITTTR